MLRPGDVLILRETEYQPGVGAILVTVQAVGVTRERDGDWWTALKVEQVTWQANPTVRFIEARHRSLRTARRRGGSNDAV